MGNITAREWEDFMAWASVELDTVAFRTNFMTETEIEREFRLSKQSVPELDAETEKGLLDEMESWQEMRKAELLRNQLHAPRKASNPKDEA